MNFRMTLAALLIGAAAALPLSANAAAGVKPYHAAAVKDCTACHTQENAVAGNAFVVPDDNACLACHASYKAVAAKTEGGEEPNPHSSNHYGENLSCTACHAEHRESRVYCNNCHEFRYKPLK